MFIRIRCTKILTDTHLLTYLRMSKRKYLDIFEYFCMYIQYGKVSLYLCKTLRKYICARHIGTHVIDSD